MSFFAVLGFALIVTVLLLLIRKERPELATLLSIAAGAIILLSLLKNIQAILTIFESVAIKAHFKLYYLKEIVKIVGLAYLAGFGAQICRDAGEGSMADKIELAGKIAILVIGVPIMINLLELVLKLF